ncbi:M15 family peptidase [Ornithinibacillus sp. L9]|uniref:M15 family peptidase n=1 Tax=Ornithinibacillus caprae TaxID=2678566 RepID=A0A6N8FJI5_9BACI|nr:M15 family metallopeptidase [Ornithinibacillus caprae]MUK89780.1 M15 family peptidase [Ornithinibacillus caprae]
MKALKTFLKSIAIILMFFAIVIYLYNYLGYNDYKYEGKDAPIPTGLHPIVKKKTEHLINEAEAQDISIVITESFRTFERQEELYAQGRSEEGSIVTYAKGGESYHNYGLAIDFAIVKENEDLTWDINYDGNGNDKSDWHEVAEIAKDLGFEWGGDWSNFKDYPHLQMTFGLSIQELKLGFRPKVETEVKQ